MLFDIQKFAEDDPKNYGDILDGNTAESEITDELPPIPKELEGLPEDIARDIMSRAESKSAESTENVPPDPPETPKTEDDGETSVSYKRFKETLDQKNELAQQLAAYRERYGDMPASSQTSQQNFPQYTQQEIPTQPRQPQLNAETMKQIDDVITKFAMEISGLSKEDVDGIDYLDDDDPRISLWNHAKELSKQKVYYDFIANQVAQQQELQRLQMLQNQSINEYNNYVAQKQAADNFEAVRQYATGEFFNAQSQVDKEIITESFSRLSRNAAYPADMMIIRDFFTRAENSYLNKNAQTAPQQKNTAPKPNFPRTNQMNGTVGNGGGVTQAELAEMLKTRKFSDIPPEYQKILLGI